MPQLRGQSIIAVIACTWMARHYCLVNLDKEVLLLLLPAASPAAAAAGDVGSKASAGAAATSKSIKLTVLLIALDAEEDLRSPSNPLLLTLTLLAEDLRQDLTGA